MPARLYFLSLSHPSQAARLMLVRKGIEHKLVNILRGKSVEHFELEPQLCDQGVVRSQQSPQHRKALPIMPELMVCLVAR